MQSNSKKGTFIVSGRKLWPHELRVAEILTMAGHNIIIDTSRMKNARDDNTRKFLISQAKSRRQIKKLIMITKQGRIIDISALI